MSLEFMEHHIMDLVAYGWNGNEEETSIASFMPLQINMDLMMNANGLKLQERNTYNFIKNQ